MRGVTKLETTALRTFKFYATDLLRYFDKSKLAYDARWEDLGAEVCVIVTTDLERPRVLLINAAAKGV